MSCNFVFCLLIIFQLLLMSKGQDLSNGLLVNYKLDGSALDSSGNGNQGTINGVTFGNNR